jgi:hypothetical protein
MMVMDVLKAEMLKGTRTKKVEETVVMICAKMNVKNLT